MAKDVRGAVLSANSIYHLHTLLHKFGGSYLGASQLLHGEIITNPKDRLAIAALLLLLSGADSSGDYTALQAMVQAALSDFELSQSLAASILSHASSTRSQIMSNLG
jgi:hypothetical protein